MDRIEFFLQFEEIECFSFKVNGVYIWKYFREEAYDNYIHNIYKTSERVSKRDPKKIKKYLKSQYFKVFKYHYRLKKKNLVFLSFPRKVLVEGQYICTQLKDIIDKYDDYYIVENPFWIEDYSYEIAHFSAYDKNEIYTDYFEMRTRLFIPFLKVFLWRFFKQKNQIAIYNWIDNINNSLNLNIDKEKWLHRVFYYVYFEKYALKFYGRVLKRIQPQCLIEIYTPNHQIAAINTVCHKLNIPIVEIQHGAIGQYEPIMYSYASKKNKDHLSDYLLTFGDFWNQKKNYHFSQNNIISVGSPFLETKKKERFNHDVFCNILIISQGRYSDLIKNIALQIRANEDFSEFNVILKLHPYEHSKYLNGEYQNLIEQGIEVFSGTDRHLYDFFIEAACVIGVNSTCLYESLAFCIPTFVLSSQYGSNDVLKLKNTGLLWEFSTTQQLMNKLRGIKDWQYMHYNMSNLYKENALNNIINEIERIRNCDRKKSIEQTT